MVASSFLFALIPAVAASPLAAGQACKAPAPKPTACSVPRNGLTIRAVSLYPESADFDESRCVTYVGNLYNSTVSVLNAANSSITNVIKFDGITNVPAFHISGLQRDARHDMLTISANAGAAFDTNGDNISGTNMLLQYDLAKGALAWQKNLTEVSGGKYGGFQDVEHDAKGNSFVVGTFPSSIVKISADGQTATEWFVGKTTDSKVHGFTGIAAFDEARSVLVPDGETGELVKFDLTGEKGVRVSVPLGNGNETIGEALDGAYLPPLFKDSVLLVSDNTLGTIVLRSKDAKWETAEKLGAIPNKLADQEGFSVATVQIADRIFAVTEYFGDNSPGKQLTRDEYPWYDITDDINKLLV